MKSDNIKHVMEGRFLIVKSVVAMRRNGSEISYISEYVAYALESVRPPIFLYSLQDTPCSHHE